MRKSIRFHDDVHFPKGFNRKGFTIKEAAILDNYGLTMKGLLDNSLTAESEEERLFLGSVAKFRLGTNVPNSRHNYAASA